MAPTHNSEPACQLASLVSHCEPKSIATLCVFISVPSLANLHIQSRRQLHALDLSSSSFTEGFVFFISYQLTLHFCTQSSSSFPKSPFIFLLQACSCLCSSHLYFVSFLSPLSAHASYRKKAITTPSVLIILLSPFLPTNHSNNFLFHLPFKPNNACIWHNNMSTRR